jgi:hypothetical protein
MANERKERVIHTRIPAQLEEQIKRLAEGLRVPVSNLVRNMLEDALDVTRRMRDAMPTGAHDKPHAPGEPGDIYGWQALTINVDAACARCSAALAPGDDAYLGLTDRPHRGRTFICPACLPGRGGNKKKGR